MIEFLKNNIVKSPKVLCIEVEMEQNQTVYHAVLVKYSAKGVRLGKAQNELSSIEEIFKIFGRKTPIILNITGKTVIIKKIVQKSDDIVNLVVPGARGRDFYHYSFTQDEYSMASVIRKSTLDEVLKSFKKENAKIIDCLFGGLQSACLGAILQQDFHTSNIRWSLNALHQPIDVSSGSEETSQMYKIGEEEIHSKSLVAFGTGLNYYSNFLTDQQSKIEELKTAKQDLLFGNLQKVLLGLFAIFILAVVGVNSIMMTDYENKNIELMTRNSEASEQSQLLNTKKAELTNKKEILENTGLNLWTKIGFYADQIAARTPTTIQYDKMAIFPLEKRIKEDSQILFSRKEISIQGTATNSFSLNDWIKDLKGLTWVEEIKILKFEKKLQERRGVFQIKIRMI
ncbi:MAG: hypothetical protein MRY83_03215 [Flavobacteriales bacterium]|nr:hypothetical protein [Flavobacteriales bacterium]